MFDGESIQLARIGDGLMEMRFDRRNAAVNVLDTRTLGELREAMALLAARKEVRGLLIDSGKESFIVGADINEFMDIFSLSDEALIVKTRESNGVLNAIEDLPFPTVAAVEGFALGGGLELALSADARVMSNTAQVGLPEIGLGIFPAYGGTVRLSRLAPLPQSLKWLLGAGMHSADEALQIGVALQVTMPGQSRAEALAVLKRMADLQLDWRAMREPKLQPVAASQSAIDEAVARFAPAARDALAKRHLPAAQVALEVVRDGCPCGRAEAQAIETSRFPEVAKSAQAAALIGIFLNEQAVKKINKGAGGTRNAPARVAVVGAGIMGGGIAYATALKGIPVRMKDLVQKQLDVGLAEARRQLDRQVRAGRMAADRSQYVLDAISAQLDSTGFETVDLAIEAVVENPDIKARVLAALEQDVPPHAVLATNTSSLRVGDLARNLRQPQRFVGLHFFNPVPAMPLVEVIRGEQTEPATVARATAFVLKLGKTPVVVKDCPGFLVNRVVTPYLRAFIRLVAEGADPYAIDRTMQDYGWPMGPAHLEDVVGLDTGSRVLDVIADGYRDRMPPIELNVLTAMSERGLLGQKSGAGFYLYGKDAEGHSTRLPNPQVADVLRHVQPDGAKEYLAGEIVDALMLPLLIEAGRCLEEEVVSTAAELDMALLLGLGYPRYLGGALKQIDQMGWPRLIRLTEHYARLGPEYRLTAGMRERARAGMKYFG